jgi:hypothetical protein
LESENIEMLSIVAVQIQCWLEVAELIGILSFSYILSDDEGRIQLLKCNFII